MRTNALCGLGRAVEVELGPRDGSPAERLAQRAHMGALVVAHDPGELGGLPRDGVDPLDLGVEARLQVLEGERVVQDGDVALGLARGLGDAGGGEGRRRRDQPRRRQHAQEPAPGGGRHRPDRLGQRAVAVER